LPAAENLHRLGSKGPACRGLADRQQCIEYNVDTERRLDAAAISSYSVGARMPRFIKTEIAAARQAHRGQ
jgi:hypothetical protein